MPESPEATTPPLSPSEPAPAGGPRHVRYRWLGDTGVWFDGVPNRDVTTDDDHLSDALMAAAVAVGTHKKVK